MKKSKKIISLQEVKSTKEFIESIESGELYEQLKLKDNNKYPKLKRIK